jgi:hypothetical protein
MAKKTIMETPRNKFFVICAAGAEKPVGAVPACHHPAWVKNDRPQPGFSFVLPLN